MPEALVITGASKGIGCAAARRFLQDGCRVVNLSRTDPGLAGVLHLRVDLTEADWTSGCEAELDAALAAADCITLVHNAGLLYHDRVDDLGADVLRTVLEVSVVAPARLNRLLLPLMKPGSSILYVGSTLSEQAVPGSCSYVTAKHAVVGLMRSTCQDLAGRDIHTACVCPGFTDTEMLRAHVGDSREALDAIASGITFGRLIDPAEIAEVLYFCARNPVVNGSVIHANLGQIAT